MRFVFCSVLLFILFLNVPAGDFENSISDRELQRLDRGWFARHPGELPIWETFAEKTMRLAQESRDYQSTRTRPAPPAPVRNVAEFEPMEGVIIAYPGNFGIPTESIKEMSEDARVYCLTENESSVENIFENGGVNMDNVILITAELNSIYTRDYGPWWIIDGNDEFAIIDFEYNRNRPDDNKTNALVGTELNVSVYNMGLTHCGGNYMTDGYGNSASSKLVVTENNNNGSNVKKVHKDYLGIETYHLMDDPNSTHIDHIDCWGKYLAPDKLLIREVPQSNQDYTELEEVVDYFKSQKSAYDTPFRIYRVTSTADNEAYTNSLILNKKVMVPLAGTSQDDQALDAYKQAMPGYEVCGYQFDSFQNTDAYHCRTKGIADRGMLYICHLPLHDTVTSIDGEGYTVEATFKAYSGKNLLSDSLLVFYRPKGQSDFSKVRFENISGDKYKAIIPQPEKSVEMSYYVHAADASGRSENHPYIGVPDPHVYFAESVGTFADFSNNHVQAVKALRNYPNPVVSQTVISCRLNTVASDALLAIYSTNGRLIRCWLLSQNITHLSWDGTDTIGNKVSAGVYYYTVTNGTMSLTKRMQVIR